MQKPGAYQTAKNAIYFLSDNWGHFMRMLLPLYPFLYLGCLGTTVYDAVGDDITVPTAFNIYAAIAIPVSGIASFAFLAAWHRAAILGVSDDNKFNFLNLSEKDKSFISGVFKYFGLCFAFVIAVGAVIFISSLIHKFLAVAVAIIGICVMFFVGMRLYLYLPAKAVGADMTLKESYHSSKGLVSKILIALLLSGIPVLILSTIVGAIVGLVIGIIVGGLATFSQALIFSIVFAFVGVILQAVATAVAAAVLSRYYVWAVQERATS